MYLLQYTAALLQITTVGYYKLRQNELQITTKNYYKLRQLLFLQKSKLLQITSIFIKITAAFRVITNYGKFCYKLRQVLQIAP